MPQKITKTLLLMHVYFVLYFVYGWVKALSNKFSRELTQVAISSCHSSFKVGVKRDKPQF